MKMKKTKKWVDKPSPVSFNVDASPFTSGKGIALTPEFEFSCYSVLFEKVINYLSNNRSKKVERAFHDYLYLAGRLLRDEQATDDVKDVFLLSFWDWAIHTPGVTSGNKTGIELYLKNDKKLTVFERYMLYRMTESVVTLFEVTGTGTATKLVFKDIFLESAPIENDFLPDNMRPPALLVGGRVISMSNGDEIGHALFPFDPDMKPYLLNERKRSWCEF